MTPEKNKVALVVMISHTGLDEVTSAVTHTEQGKFWLLLTQIEVIWSLLT